MIQQLHQVEVLPTLTKIHQSFAKVRKASSNFAAFIILQKILIQPEAKGGFFMIKPLESSRHKQHRRKSVSL